MRGLRRWKSGRSFRRWLRFSVISSPEEAMMWGGLLLVLTVSVACITAKKARQGCQSIKMDMCRDAGYRRTKFPNRLGHRKQDHAANDAQYHLLDVIINGECSAHFKTLACLLYAPPCDNLEDDTGLPVYPCRSLCRAAKDDCLPWLEANGYRWPRIFNCSQFPDRREEKCNGHVERTSAQSFTGTCETITIPLCADVSYSTAGYPNHLGQGSQEAASLDAHMFFPLVKVQCSPHLKEFVCGMYAPPCDSQRNAPPLRPCRSLCQAARSGCEDWMSKFGFRWPGSLECDLLPTVGEEEDCFGHVPTLPPPTYPPAEGTCEDITIPYCQNLQYSKTRFPHAREDILDQQEASREIAHLFMTHFGPDCSPQLRQFVCHMYAPPCGSDEIPQLPCRSLCEAVRAECMERSWPESLNCNYLPPDDEAPCFGIVEPTEAPPSVSPSELLDRILRDYDRMLRPDTGPTTVNIGMTLRRILTLDTENGLLTLHTWINMEWKDKRLIYGNTGVRRLELSVRYLWMPDIFLISGVKAEEMPLPLTTEASIFSDGTVRYVVPWTFTVPCRKRSESDWDCQVVFQSWNKPADEIALSPVEHFLDAEEYNGGLQWNVQSVSADRLITNVRDEADKSRLIFTLVVAKHVSEI